MAHPDLAASVVVPTHRGAHRLPPLLAALAAQDSDEDWEVVVVVDGPDPATDAVLARRPAGLPLVVVHRQWSTGVAGALNAGLRAARAYGRPQTERAVAAVLAAPEAERWRHWAAHCSDELWVERREGTS